MPSPSATPLAASDACGGPNRLLATLNRPTVGYSPCAVPPGAIVLEEGYQNTVSGGNAGTIAVAYPQGFERIGVGAGFEIDAIGPNFNRLRTGAKTTGGYSDSGLGFKYELPQRGRFTYAFDGLFTAASGNGAFTSGVPSETLNLDLNYALSSAVGVGTTLAGVDSATEGLGRYGSFEPSIVVTAVVPQAYQLYAEVVGVTKIAPQAGGRVFTDFGVQKLLGPYLEVDAEYGLSFTPLGGSRFKYVGVGAGVRVK